ncbi:hypothetical protein AB0B45_09085 [Nonomuraea sp. NPDC049152]|uniref:hypothetical protein n=1 Tax=Nonomuraea sp. NPDC049152 TaxID=3154350 RepID=UPI00340D88A8
MKTRNLAAGVAAVACSLVTVGGAAQAATAVPKFEPPKIFGTTFQADPGHDFTKGIHSRRDGILRGWITDVQSDGTAEYEPIKWKRDKYTEGFFVGPPEGDVMAYASPIAKKAVYLSAFGCGKRMSAMTVDRRTGLGNKSCSRSVLLKRVEQHQMPSLITVHKGQIVKVQEIFTP